jgi:hypothetical protein
VTRTHRAGTQWPLLSVGVALMAGVLGIAIFTYQEYQIWTPLQRWYFNEYSLTQEFPTQHGNYWLLMKTDRAGHRSVAGNGDVVADFRGRHYLFPFELSQQTRQQGTVQLNLETVHYSSAQMNQILREQVFAGQCRFRGAHGRYYGCNGEEYVEGYPASNVE